MENRRKIVLIAAALAFHLSIYLYLDKVLLAPTSAYQVSATGEHNTSIGKAYYSRDRKYMAIAKAGSVEISAMPGNKVVRTIELGNQKLTYFKWLEDRDLALMALQSETGDTSRVVLSQVNPVLDGQGLAATINKLPTGSQIVDVAYSTATNVIYMQVQVAANPVRYRVYRTDANQELARVYFNTDRIGRIGVLFDQDSLIFDDMQNDTVLVRHGDGSWQVISPQVGKFRLVGVDLKNNIYIAKINADGLGDMIYKGRLGGKFQEHRKLNAPADTHSLKVADVLEANR